MAKGPGHIINQDVNNNEDLDDLNSSSKTQLFIQRHLELSQNDDFLIIPNGGTGDCMFKAVSQAVYNGDESMHKEIRKEVVEFIISQKWEKFSEFIEVQHINGNNLLQRQWSKDPKQTYKMYMSLPGTLGSSSELTAAAELYQYNFATVQEYCNNSQRTYRVENCILFDQTKCDFHYFYFTGEYDNGHWEYMKISSGITPTDDGTYHGRHKTVIEGEEITIEAWLQRETENTNSADKLKIYTNRSLHEKRRSSYPFAMANFKYGIDGTVKIKGIPFTIEDIESTDLFSVLAHACSQNEGSAHETELILIKTRYSYFEDINYKLMTQPWSHNFTTEAIRYSGYPCKGNIQDLICAADLYSFSFVLFMKLNSSSVVDGETEGEVHECKFTHVDRWGGENESTLHFFMRLVKAPNGKDVVAKWWLLTPYKQKVSSQQLSRNKSKSKHVFKEGGDINLPAIQAIPKVSSVQMTKEDVKKFYSNYDIVTNPGRPMTVDMKRSSSHVDTPRPKSSKSASAYVSYNDDDSYQQQRRYNDVQFATIEMDNDTACRQAMEKGASEDEPSDGNDSIQKDFENIFGTVAHSPFEKRITPSPETHLVKTKMRANKMKPATGRDLVKHPEKVRTVVKVRDKSNTGREIMYESSGYMKSDDVLDDLRKQGVIRPLPEVPFIPTTTTSRHRKEFSFDKIFMADSKKSESRQFNQKRDSNFNVVEKPNSTESVISYENNEKDRKHLQYSSDDQEQFFFQGLSTYTNGDQPRIKRNKTSPRSSDILAQQASHHSRQPVPTDNTDTENMSNGCLTGLLALMRRISAQIRRISQIIKRGMRRRYIQYHQSSSLFQFPAVRVPVPLPRRSSNGRVEPEFANLPSSRDSNEQ